MCLNDWRLNQIVKVVLELAAVLWSLSEQPPTSCFLMDVSHPVWHACLCGSYNFNISVTWTENTHRFAQVSVLCNSCVTLRLQKSHIKLSVSRRRTKRIRRILWLKRSRRNWAPPRTWWSSSWSRRLITLRCPRLRKVTRANQNQTVTPSFSLTAVPFTRVKIRKKESTWTLKIQKQSRDITQTQVTVTTWTRLLCQRVSVTVTRARGSSNVTSVEKLLSISTTWRDISESTQERSRMSATPAGKRTVKCQYWRGTRKSTRGRSRTPARSVGKDSVRRRSCRDTWTFTHAKRRRVDSLQVDGGPHGKNREVQIAGGDGFC